MFEKEGASSSSDAESPTGVRQVHSPTIDKALERRVVRKLDFNLVPIVFALYLLAFLDRSNIGNAELAGMKDDLHLSDSQYQWLLTIFYISYIVFEVGIVMWKVCPPHMWAAFVVLVWGICSSCLAAVQNWSGAMALRFFMGAAEAAYGPGVPYLLSFFYLRHELGFRTGIFLAAAPLASSFAGALAYGITHAKDSAVKPWRLLFLVEGLPTILMSPVAYFFLPDSPASARFLTAEEKEVGVARGVRQTGEGMRIGGLNGRDVLDTLLDYKPWFTALIYFSCNVSFASLPVYLPTILNGMGFSKINAQGLSAPPYLLGFIVTIASAWIADRTAQRGATVTILALTGGIGYIILATTENNGARYFAVFLVASGVFPAIANTLPWVMNNQGTDTRRGIATVMLNTIGQCGPLLGTRVYPETDEPRYVKGHSICAAFMFFVAVLAFTLRWLLWWENKKLDKKYGTIEEQRLARETKAKEEEEATGVKQTDDFAAENYGPMYRFVL